MQAARDPDRPTGVYFKQRTGGTTTMLYRAGSAASALAPEDVPDEAFDGVDLDALDGHHDRARSRPSGTRARRRPASARRWITVLLDPNYRPALWDGLAEAAAALPRADWVLCGLDEGNLLFGTDSPDALATAIGTDVAIRVGERGALVTEDGRLVEVRPPRVEDVVDEVARATASQPASRTACSRAGRPTACANAANVVAAGAARRRRLGDVPAPCGRGRAPLGVSSVFGSGGGRRRAVLEHVVERRAPADRQRAREGGGLTERDDTSTRGG